MRSGFKPSQYFHTNECYLTGGLSFLLVPVFSLPSSPGREGKKEERKEEMNLN